LGFALAAIVTLGAALAASFIPAWRTTRVNALLAPRSE
jgi:ABC-type lipoprotein release transport system permease subunit